ncbi:hypothetical protein GCM10009715_33380 [Paeniglutamicibacter psychrophenolicus]
MCSPAESFRTAEHALVCGGNRIVGASQRLAAAVFPAFLAVDRLGTTCVPPAALQVPGGIVPPFADTPR